ncbi:MAG: bacterio-opsin activator domain-containing protein [Halobacteria archaeon]|nr:bacterio-opsin activator domain-containing protein [Halobacteria archaeon]
MSLTDKVLIRLLWVGDKRDPDNLSRANRHDNMTVITETNAAEALDRLEEETINCIVSEHDLPGMNGLEFLKVIRSRYPDLPFILIPKNGNENLASRAISAGVTDYVPFEGTQEQLGYITQRVRSAVLNPQEARKDMTSNIKRYDHIEEDEYRLKERAMDEAPVGITIADAEKGDLPLIYINESFEELTGYPEEEVLGLNCRFLQGEESDEEAVASMSQAIEENESVSVELINYRKNGEKFWNKVDISPIRDREGEVTHFVGFQTDITDRKEAELEAERKRKEAKRERRNLEHVLDRINGLIKDTIEILVQSTSSTEIEQRVCERLTREDAYGFAWVGEPGLLNDVITPSEWSGDGMLNVRNLSIDPNSEEAKDNPVARAMDTRNIQITQDITEVHGSDLNTTFGAMAAIPLVYKDTLYGVLNVYANQADSFNEREVVVLEALGRTVANAINSVETKQILITDNVVELEIETDDTSLFFVNISKQTECNLEYNGSVYRENGRMLMFFTVTGATPKEVLETADECHDLEGAELITENEEGGVYQFTVSGSPIVRMLADYGARTQEITVESGKANISLELPNKSNARSVIETLKDRYSETRLGAYRERERPARTKQEYRSSLEERLTEKQLTVLQKAYVSGFFEWPRTTDGDKLSKSMDISRSTFHQHLRAAEKKLVEEFFEG